MVEEDVVIGSECILEPYVYVKRWTTLGAADYTLVANAAPCCGRLSADGIGLLDFVGRDADRRAKFSREDVMTHSARRKFFRACTCCTPASNLATAY